MGREDEAAMERQRHWGGGLLVCYWRFVRIRGTVNHFFTRNNMIYSAEKSVHINYTVDVCARWKYLNVDAQVQFGGFASCREEQK